ncbi:hypothetical protein IMZ38_01600 [Thermosphaera chiliense]|uniref:Uncharacterized protein n=1 Tax=Thermosphaera chiliense TaxID=3402707 RepID=A0A7M1URH9_9CREN|nr:hypothetical protein [Thermosphaera aggregans]QOR94656.1 hypothetical protein IMZ38_01600 [Thermosphaera aggregans]
MFKKWFFKSDVEKFEDLMKKGFDEIKKRQFKKAADTFREAYEVAKKSKDPVLFGKANLALFYALFYEALHNLHKGKPTSFKQVAEQCKKLEPNIELDLGLVSKVYPLELARELEILAEYYDLPSFEINKIKSMDLNTAEKYERVANILLSEGNKRLILENLVNIHKPLDVIGFKLLGFSRIIKAANIEEENPLKAKELYSEASTLLPPDDPEVQNIKEFISDRISKLKSDVEKFEDLMKKGFDEIKKRQFKKAADTFREAYEVAKKIKRSSIA